MSQSRKDALADTETLATRLRLSYEQRNALRVARMDGGIVAFYADREGYSADALYRKTVSAARAAFRAVPGVRRDK